jgi:hypothetical protein
MAQPTAWETVKVQGNQILEQLKRLLHEGNVRRVAVKQKGRTIAEFPVTVGVVGALAAPALAAVGALVAVLADCSIEVERAVEPRAEPRSRGAREAPRSRSTGEAPKARAGQGRRKPTRG